MFHYPLLCGWKTLFWLNEGGQHATFGGLWTDRKRLAVYIAQPSVDFV